MYNRTKKRSLFVKHFFVIVLTIFVCFTVLGFALMFSLFGYWTNQKCASLAENAQTVAKAATVWVNSYDIFQQTNNARFALCDTLSVVSQAIDADVFICDKSGDVIFCKDLALDLNRYIINSNYCNIHGEYTIPKNFLGFAENSGNYVVTTDLAGIYKRPYFVACEPVFKDGESVLFVLVAGQSDEGFPSFLTDVAKMFLFSAFLALIIAFISVYIFTYRLINPMREMSKATKAFSDGDFSYRVVVAGNDELSDLAEAFNSMAGALGKLEASRRSFVANVSHELKTPMTTIGGFIDGILDGTIPKEKEKYYLDIVSNEVRRLSRLVMAMLNMSKIEAGEFKLQPKRFDLSSRIFQVFLSFERNIDLKHIDIEGLDSMKSVFVEADEDMLHQVVYNLVDNAVKFTPHNGVISVSAITDNEKVIVRIKNTGGGISSEELPRIFERFYKVDKSRSDDIKGAGLGLYIIKNIIELHGGQITVKSAMGEYTEFIFWIPLKYGDAF